MLSRIHYDYKWVNQDGFPSHVPEGAVPETSVPLGWNGSFQKTKWQEPPTLRSLRGRCRGGTHRERKKSAKSNRREFRVEWTWHQPKEEGKVLSSPSPSLRTGAAGSAKFVPWCVKPGAAEQYPASARQTNWHSKYLGQKCGKWR